MLRTDASTTGFGGVLIQLMPLEELSPGGQAQAIAANMVDARQLVVVPIAFANKAFTAPAQKWAATELELFAIIHSLKKLESLLILKPFVIETDHKNLVSDGRHARLEPAAYALEALHSAIYV